MAYPQIVYNGGTDTLTFTFPPVMKPGADDKEADRDDNITLNGLKQTMWERNDIFKNLQMDYVPADDMLLWDMFMEYALTGQPFDYYPDADNLGTFTTYTLEDTKWQPKYNMHGIAKFSLRLRQYVADTTVVPS